MSRSLRETGVRMRSSARAPAAAEPSPADVSRLGPLRSAPRREKLLRGFLPLLIVGVTVAVFAPVWDAQFLNWDDDLMFTQNYAFRGFGREQLRWMFTTGLMGHYQPLSWLTAALDYQIGGMQPRSYHVQNLVWHTGTALMLYWLARRLIGLALQPAGAPEGRVVVRCWAAAAAALLFAVHPLRVESVAWATERRDVVSGFFFVAALLAYVRAVAPGRVAIRSHGWHFVTVVCVALSLLAKAWGVALPVIMLVLDCYPLRRLPAGHGWRSRASLAVVVQKLPALLLALGAGVTAILAQRTVDWGVMSLSKHGLEARIAQALYGIAFYPLRTLWPRELVTIVQIPKGFGLASNSVLLACAVTVVISAACLLLRRRYPALLAVWVCYLVTIFPVLGVAQSGQQLVADRYSYLSCLGFPVLVAGGAAALALAGDAFLRRLAQAGLVAACAVIIVLGTMSHRYARCWQTAESLWEYTVRIVPESWIAQVNYGSALFVAGKREQSVEHLRRSTELNPKAGHAWHNYGVVLNILGRSDEAERALIQAVEFYSLPEQSELELGFLHLRLKRYQDAVERFTEAMRKPVFEARARGGRGSCFLRLGYYEAAIAEFERAMALDPSLSGYEKELRLAREQLERQRLQGR